MVSIPPAVAIYGRKHTNNCSKQVNRNRLWSKFFQCLLYLSTWHQVENCGSFRRGFHKVTKNFYRSICKTGFLRCDFAPSMMINGNGWRHFWMPH